jgi:hypothetical protein
MSYTSKWNRKICRKTPSPWKWMRMGMTRKERKMKMVLIIWTLCRKMRCKIRSSKMISREPLTRTLTNRGGGSKNVSNHFQALENSYEIVWGWRHGGTVR